MGGHVRGYVYPHSYRSTSPQLPINPPHPPHPQELLTKEREIIHAAQALVRLEGRLEQLTARLQLEQQRATILSDGAHDVNKRLHRQVRQLTAELGAKEEEVKRVRLAADQLRMLVANGTLAV